MKISCFFRASSLVNAMHTMAEIAYAFQLAKCMRMGNGICVKFDNGTAFSTNTLTTPIAVQLPTISAEVVWYDYSTADEAQQLHFLHFFASALGIRCESKKGKGTLSVGMWVKLDVNSKEDEDKVYKIQSLNLA